MSRLLTTAICLGYAALVLPEAAGQRVEHTLLSTYSELCTWGRDAYGLSEDQWRKARRELKSRIDGARIRFDGLPVEGGSLKEGGFRILNPTMFWQDPRDAFSGRPMIARFGFRILREGNTPMVFNEKNQIVGPLPGYLPPKVEAFWRSFDKFDRIGPECPPWWIWFQFPPEQLQLKVSDTLRIDGFGRIIALSHEDLDVAPYGHIVTTIELLSWRPSGI